MKTPFKVLTRLLVISFCLILVTFEEGVTKPTFAYAGGSDIASSNLQFVEPNGLLIDTFVNNSTRQIDSHDLIMGLVDRGVPMSAVNRMASISAGENTVIATMDQQQVYLPLVTLSPSWENIGLEGFRTRDVVFSMEEPPGILVATESEGLKRGQACGDVTWTALGPANMFSLSALSEDNMLLAGTFGQGLWRRHGNENWARIQDVNNPYVWTLAKNPAVPFVYAGTDAGVFRFDELNEQWVQWSDGLSGSALLIDDLHVDADGNVWAATYGAGVWLSTPTEPMWARRNNGLPTLALQAWKLVRGTPDQLYLGTSNGVFQQDADTGVWNEYGLSDKRVYALTIVDESETVFAGTRNSGVYIRVSSSNPWEPFTAGLPSGTEVRALLVVPECSAVIAATSNGVWRRPLPSN